MKNRNLNEQSDSIKLQFVYIQLFVAMLLLR